MTFSWTYCVLTCVSRESQATEDRDSLDHQLRTCRAYGERIGGTFVQEFRAEGYSRTGYFDLSKAFADAPPLGDMARGAAKHAFDVILMESFDRLGDLGFIFWNYLKSIGEPYIQLRSVQQSLPISDPSIYNPFHDDVTPTVINNSLNTNVYRIHKIVRAFEVGIPKRARDGKYSRRLPLGYKFTGDKKNYKVELDPIIKSVLIDLKNKYMAGWTLPALEEYAERIHPIGWRRNRIKEIFRNPFFAGKTFYDRGVTVRAKNGRRGHWQPKDEPIILYDGLHESVWDLDTYHTLVAEIERRGKHMRNRREYPLTGLVICATCNAHMHIDTIQNQRWKYYRCRSCGLLVRENIVMDEFIKALRIRVSEFQDAPLEQPPVIDNSRAIAALRKQLEKVRMAYETTDSYTPEEYANRKRDIMKEIAQLEDVEQQQEKQEREQHQRKETLELVRQLLPDIDGWMKETPAGEVNVALSRFVEGVMVSPDKTVDVRLG